jgi:hypothetical protein
VLKTFGDAELRSAESARAHSLTALILRVRKVYSSVCSDRHCPELKEHSDVYIPSQRVSGSSSNIVLYTQYYLDRKGLKTSNSEHALQRSYSMASQITQLG